MRRLWLVSIGRGKLLLQNRLQHTPDIFRQDALARRVRMDAIGQVQLGVATDPFQQIRDKRRAIFFGQRAKHPSERAHIAVARREGQLHSGDDNRHVWLPRPRPIDDRLEIRSHLFDRHAAEGVVDAERQDQDIDSLPAKQHRQTPKPASRGIAARSRVDDLESIIRVPHLFSDQGRIGFFAREAEAIGQTISENEDGDHPGSIVFRRRRGLKRKAPDGCGEKAIHKQRRDLHGNSWTIPRSIRSKAARNSGRCNLSPPSENGTNLETGYDRYAYGGSVELEVSLCEVGVG